MAMSFSTPITLAYGPVIPTSVMNAVPRADQSRLLGKIFHDFFLVPSVIAGGHRIDSQREEILGQAWRDAESRGGVFTIGQDQINGMVAGLVRQMLLHGGAAGTSKDVA